MGSYLEKAEEFSHSCKEEISMRRGKRMNYSSQREIFKESLRPFCRARVSLSLFLPYSLSLTYIYIDGYTHRHNICMFLTSICRFLSFLSLFLSLITVFVENDIEFIGTQINSLINQLVPPLSCNQVFVYPRDLVPSFTLELSAESRSIPERTLLA